MLKGVDVGAPDSGGANGGSSARGRAREKGTLGDTNNASGDSDTAARYVVRRTREESLLDTACHRTCVPSSVTLDASP